MNDTELSTNLNKLGFTEGCIVEIILVSRNMYNFFNAAPMGVIRTNSMLKISPFNSSETYKNLHRTKHASINITDDPMLFFKTAFKNQLEEPFSLNDWLIQGSNAVIFVEKKKEEFFSGNRSSFILKPTKVIINKKEPMVFSRGRAEAIEAIIHATRVCSFQYEKREKEIKELLKNIKYSFDIITRVSNKKSSERRVVECLKNLFENWGIEF